MTDHGKRYTSPLLSGTYKISDQQGDELPAGWVWVERVDDAINVPRNWGTRIPEYVTRLVEVPTPRQVRLLGYEDDDWLDVEPDGSVSVTLSVNGRVQSATYNFSMLASELVCVRNKP